MSERAYRFADPRDDLQPTHDAIDVEAALAEMARRSADTSVLGAAYRLGVWSFDVGRLVPAYRRGSLEDRAWRQGYEAARETECERRLAAAFAAEAERVAADARRAA